MASFLSTYRPISTNARGARAAAEYGIPPYVDASCRREPDLESPYPSISALCRVRLFAPRLHPGDRVVYLTRKGRYGDVGVPHWRLVAILRILQRFEGHELAATWYRERGEALPKNCIVEGNPPTEICRTGGPRPFKVFGDPGEDPERALRLWDRTYHKRAQTCGVFLATEALLLDLHRPMAITEDDLHLFGGRMPCTQNPPRIDDSIVDRLLELAAGRRNDRAA